MSGVSNNLGAFETAIQAMYGGWGAAFGQGFEIFRLSANTPSSGIANDNPIVPLVNVRLKRMSSKDVLEGEIFSLVAFDAAVNGLRLKLGDVARETGLGSTGTYYTYAQHRISGKNIWVRTESLATITRPTAAGQTTFPTNGPAIAPGYLGESHASAIPLTLAAGEFSFVSGGSPVSVPIGIEDNVRASEGGGDNAAGKLDTKIAITQYMVYVPNMPGIRLQLRDVLHVTQTDQILTDDYKVIKFINTNKAGFRGYICICDRVPLGG